MIQEEKVKKLQAATPEVDETPLTAQANFKFPS